MRILIFASLPSSLRNFRGSLIIALQASGHDVHVAAPGLFRDTPTMAWLSARKAVCHDVPLSRVGLNPASDLWALISLCKVMRDVEPDVFLGYTVKPVIFGLIAAKLQSIPQRVALVTGLGYAFTEGSGGIRRLVRIILCGLYRLALRYATLIFFQNRDDSACFYGLGLIPGDVPVQIVAGSGVDLDCFPMQPLPFGPVRFLMIARLLVDKGIREYVAAARLVHEDWPEVEFHLVGGTDSNPASIPYDEVMTWHDAGDLIWHGHLQDVRPILSSIHVYVLPSYREGMPRTVLEAMATARPIITTDAPGCRETVINGVNGYLVPPRDVSSLAEAMLRMIKQPQSETKRMAMASFELARVRFDVKTINAQMLEVMKL